MTTPTRVNLQFNGTSVTRTKLRKAERAEMMHSDGAKVAAAVLSWKPLAPPHRGGLPAGDDGGRALFAGKHFRVRDSIYADGEGDYEDGRFSDE